MNTLRNREQSNPSQETTSPDAHRASGEGREITVKLSPAVALILRLVRIATDLDDDEIIARGIGNYAKLIGIPALARDMTVDLTDVPEFVRPNIDRYRNGGP